MVIKARANTKTRAAGSTQKLKPGRKAKNCITDDDRKYPAGSAKTAETKTEEAEKAKESYESKLDALNQREKEIHLKELQVNKLIKDNELEQKIKTLEKDLK